MKRLLLISLLFALLPGCGRSVFDNEARCPFVDRGGCQSMEMVNLMVSERCFTADGLFVQQAYQPVNEDRRRCR